MTIFSCRILKINELMRYSKIVIRLRKIKWLSYEKVGKGSKKNRDKNIDPMYACRQLLDSLYSSQRCIQSHEKSWVPALALRTGNLRWRERPASYSVKATPAIPTTHNHHFSNHLPSSLNH